jgi:hypothetical protein
MALLKEFSNEYRLRVNLFLKYADETIKTNADFTYKLLNVYLNNFFFSEYHYHADKYEDKKECTKAFFKQFDMNFDIGGLELISDGSLKDIISVIQEKYESGEVYRS